MVGVALTFAVLDLTGSISDLGDVFAARTIPLITQGVDRRRAACASAEAAAASTGVQPHVQPLRASSPRSLPCACPRSPSQPERSSPASARDGQSVVGDDPAA